MQPHPLGNGDILKVIFSPLLRGWGCMHKCVCRGWQQKREIQQHNKLGIEAASMYVDNWSFTL